MRIINTLFVSGLTLALPLTVQAAALSIEPSTDHEGPGFTVQVIIQYDRPINALEGELVFDPGLMRIDRIIESPAGVPLWIERPVESEAGKLTFAGIFPGGIEPKLTDRLSVMDITFEVLAPGEATLDISNERVLLHSPVPQDDDVRVLPLTVLLSRDDIGTPTAVIDEQAPESFSLFISSDEDVQDGRAVALYGTRDLQSGIDAYDIRERFLGVFGRYRSAQSPTELSALWRLSIIEVRATDRAGNAVTARHIPVTLVVVYALFGLLGFWCVRRARRNRV